MQRLTAVLAAAMLVTAGLPAAAAVAGQPAEGGILPGAQFAGAVGVQGAEVEGEIEGRALERRFAAAESNASRASVVAAESERAEERLSALRERRSTLRERYENGSISRAEYRARLASVAAASRALERRLNETAEAARSLPPGVARERGVNASALADLRANADSLDDGEASEAAREIAGGSVGDGLGGPPEDVGPPDHAGGEAADRNGRNGDDTAGPPDGVGGGRDDTAATGVPGDDARNRTAEDAPGGGPPADRGNRTDDVPGAAGNAGEGRGNGSEVGTDDTPGIGSDGGPPGTASPGNPTVGESPGNAPDDGTPGNVTAGGPPDDRGTDSRRGGDANGVNGSAGAGATTTDTDTATATDTATETGGADEGTATATPADG